MVVRPTIRTFAYIVFFLLMMTGALAACGDSSSTTASSSSDSGTPAAGNGPQRFSGTVIQYNASAKTVTIIESDSEEVTFSVSNARILKSQQITQQQLSSLLGNSGTIVQVKGQQDSTGTYSAQTIVVTDRAHSKGSTGAPGQNAQPNGTPAAGAPQGQNGNSVVVRNGKLQNNQLVGTDRAGKTVTVDLSGTTTILQQTVVTASDLQRGQKVTILSAPAQSGSTADARQIVIGDASMTG